jgi:hypothetical protein
VQLRLDTNDNVRVALDLITRDFIQVGQGLPSSKVVSMPSGAGSSPVDRPGPDGANLTFAGPTAFSAVTTGDGLGPEVAGLDSDIVTVIYVDSQYESLPVTLAADGTAMTVDANEDGDDDPATSPEPAIANVNDPILPGDLILFKSGSRSSVQLVTRLNGAPDQTVYFDTGGTDTLNINQRGAAQGSVMDLIAAGGPVTASRLRMVTYYLDTTAADGVPRLIRRLNMRAGQVVARGIENLQFTYDLVDGVTNPTNIASPTSPNQIRKINVAIGARSRARFAQMDDFVHTSLATQVSLRSMAFVDRYR